MGMFRALIRSAVGRIVEISSSDSLLSPGGLRTRAGDTGGADIYTRNIWHGPVSYNYWADGSGSRIFGSGPDGSPATAWCFFLGSSPLGLGSDPLAIDLTTGEVNAPILTSTTQSAGDNSTNVATTAYADAAAAGGYTKTAGTNDQSGSSYTLVLADAGKDVRCTHASAFLLTIPAHSSVPFQVGTVSLISQGSTGTVSIVGDTGVTIVAANGSTTTAPGDARGIEQTDTDVWRIW